MTIKGHTTKGSYAGRYAVPKTDCPFCSAKDAELKLYKERYELEQIRYEGISSANDELRRHIDKLEGEDTLLRAEISDATALAYNLDPDRTEPSDMELCEQIAHLETHIRPTGTISGENVPPCPFCEKADAELKRLRTEVETLELENQKDIDVLGADIKRLREAAEDILANGYDQGRRIKLRAALKGG